MEQTPPAPVGAEEYVGENLILFGSRPLEAPKVRLVSSKEANPSFA